MITHKDYNDNYMVDTRASKGKGPRKKEDAPRNNRTSAFKVDDEYEERKPTPKVKRSKSEEDDDDWQQERKPRVHKTSKPEKMSSGGLSITPVATKTKTKPKKEEEDDIWNVNMNYISAGSSADSDEEEEKTRTRLADKMFCYLYEINCSISAQEAPDLEIML